MARLLKEEREHVDHASGMLLSTYLFDNFTLEAACLKQSCANLCSPLGFLILVNRTKNYCLTNTEVSEMSPSPLLDISMVSKLYCSHTSRLLSTQASSLKIEFVKLVFSIFWGRLCFLFFQPTLFFIGSNLSRIPNQPCHYLLESLFPPWIFVPPYP